MQNFNKEKGTAKISLLKVIMLAIPLLYLNLVHVFGAGIEGISAYSTGGATIQTNDLLNSGSQLNWSFTNNSAVNVTLMSMQLIDGATGAEGNLMSVNQFVGSGETVSYTTTIGVLGIHIPVTCRFRYNYNGVEYFIDATYTGSYGPGPIGPSNNYTLSIKATGNGHASYNGTTIRNNTETFNISFLGSATISFTPDNGYRIKSVKVNNSDVTSKITNNQYYFNNISDNQSVEVEFEAIPIAPFNLTIKASGNGYASYNSKNVRSQTSTFTVNENTSATISFVPDDGYRIKYVKENNTDVTSKLKYNQYTINSISSNTTVEVEFEAKPSTTYFLTIKASGNGSVTYDNMVIRNQSKSFTVNKGINAAFSFSPDNGYQIKKVQVNGSDVTINGSNNQYTISNIQRNTTLDVYFEVIPPKTYTLTITASGNGSATFDGNTVRGKSSSFSVNEGTNAIITFAPDNGYRIKNVKVNNSDVTNNISSNRYTINNVSSNTTLNVEYEAVPPTIYTLTISATGSGHVSCNDISVEKGTQTLSIESGSSVTIKLYPNDGYQIKIVKVNKSDVTSSISNNQYTIYKIDSNTTVEVEFEQIVNSMIVDGVNYVVNDQHDKTIQVAAGDYGLVLEVPATVRYSNQNWSVVGIGMNALTNCEHLSAVIWEPEAQFNEKVNNPNFLLYVSDEKYASRSVKNVVVNGVAESIELTDAANGNDFYCPRAFKARSIVYSHNYQMETGIGDSRGWETIVLPFDVQKYTHATKGELESFTTWSKDSSKKPFWLFELTADGYRDVADIKANTPYIISMPNNQQYEQQYQIPGIVTFSASDVEVQKSDNLKPGSYQGRSLVPNYTNKSDENYLALNVSNNYVTNPGKDISGSKFVRGLRTVHPFEAYMITTDNTRSIDVMEGMTTAIRGIQMVKDEASVIKVYDTRGVLMKTATSMDDVWNGLKAGVYIVNGKKMVIK